MTGRRWLAALMLVALVGGTAAGCDDKGTVTAARVHGAAGEKCTLTVRLDGVDENGNPKPVINIERRSLDCKRCPKGARWPDCLKTDVQALLVDGRGQRSGR